MSMNKVAIPNIGVKVWTQKSAFPQGDFLCSLAKPTITRHRPFNLTENQYDQIQYGITRMELVDYNTAVGRKFMIIYDIEHLAKF